MPAMTHDQWLESGPGGPNDDEYIPEEEEMSQLDDDEDKNFEDVGNGTGIATLPSPSKLSPAQVKEGAVSSLLVKATERTSELRLTIEETKALKADFPDEAFRPGAAGKENLIYIEHADLRHRLDEVLGMGQAALVPRSSWKEEFTFHKDGKEKIGVRVYVQAMFIVRGCYITEAVGEMTYYPGNPGADYSDAFEGAETAAFRRCAKKFGVGLQAWSKTWCEGWWRRKGTQTPIVNQQEQQGDEPSAGPWRAAPCPKCGKTASVIVGKPEYGGGLVCFKKKGGCGHKWGGKDVRTGEDAQPVPEQASIIAEWTKKLDPDTVNLAKLNGEIMTAYKAIPGQHKDRAKVWAMVLKFCEPFGIIYNHGERKFTQQTQE